MIIYALLGYVMGICIVIFAYKGYMEEVIDTRFRKEVIELEGEVVDFADVINASRTGYLIAPVISFSYNGVSKQELVATNARHLKRYQMNQKVIVCYNPTLFEKKVVIKKDYSDIRTAVMCMLIGIYFLGIGIAATYYGVKLDVFI